MRSAAFKIAAIYIVSGLLWIILSDKLLDLATGSMSQSTVLLIGSVKGLAYVLLTGVVLYRLILYYHSRLEESEIQYRSYFEANPSPMWIYNRRTLIFTAVNNAAIARYGYTLDEFKHMNILDIRPKADVSRVHTTIKNLPDGYNDSGIWTHLKKDGTSIKVRVTSHVIKHGKEEHVMAMATEVIDI